MSNNTPLENREIRGITGGASVRLTVQIIFIVGSVVWLYHGITSKIDDLMRVTSDHEKRFDKMGVDDRTQDVRLSTLELQVGVLQEQIKEIKNKNETQTK